jgi:hypothetical protein
LRTLRGGGTVGITIIFGASGAGLAGWKMARRAAGLTDFAFKPVRGEDTGLPVIIYAPGFHVLRWRLCRLNCSVCCSTTKFSATRC